MKEELVIAYQEVFNSENGKKVLKDLERACRFHQNAFNPDSDRVTSYNLGCVWVVQYIHNSMNKNLFEKQEEEVLNEGIKL